MHLAFSKAQTEELLVPLKASKITLGIVTKFVQHISHDKHACINFNIHNCTARRQRKLVVLCEVNIAVADYFAGCDIQRGRDCNENEARKSGVWHSHTECNYFQSWMQNKHNA